MFRGQDTVLSDYHYKLNHPLTTLNMYGHTCVYFLTCIDNIGDTMFGGGITVVLGYSYGDDNHGFQLCMKYYPGTSMRYRCLDNGNWTELFAI